MRKSVVISRLRNAPPLSDKQAVQYVSENIALFLWRRGIHILLGRPFLHMYDRRHGFLMDLIPDGLGGSAGANPSGSVLGQFRVLDAEPDDDEVELG